MDGCSADDDGAYDAEGTNAATEEEEGEQLNFTGVGDFEGEDVFDGEAEDGDVSGDVEDAGECQSDDVM